MSAIELNKLKSDIVCKLDIRAIYQEHLPPDAIKSFDGNGWSNRVLCPIHNDQATPNFFFNQKTGGFKCHACGAGGSLFDFWLYTNGYNPEDKSSLKHAIVALATDAKIDLDEWKRTGGTAYAGSISAERRAEVESHSKSAVQHNKAKANDAAKEPISLEKVKMLTENLTPDRVKFLLYERGLKLPTIHKFQIGFDERWWYKHRETNSTAYGRFTIPVFNVDGECRNLRGYTNKTDPKFKVVNYVVGRNTDNPIAYGSPPRLLNINLLVKEDWEHVVICEGEFDAMLMYQNLQDGGFTNWGAVTGTHGVRAFEAEWLPYLHGKYIYICTDCDDEGKLAAQSMATKFFLPGIRGGAFKSVRIVTLPLDGTKSDKDITDFFVKRGHGVDEFIQLCEASSELIVGGMDNDEASIEPTKVDSFIDAVLDRRYIDQRITVPITISGNTSKIYHAVHKFEVIACPMKSTGECCNDGAGVQTIPYGHPLFIQSCMQSEKSTYKEIGHYACKVGQRCTVAPVEKVVMHEYFAHQVVDRLEVSEVDGHFVNTQELLTVPIYVLQPKESKMSEPRNYLATGYIRTHPSTSLTTMCVETLEPLEDEWSNFDASTTISQNILTELRDNFTTDGIVKEITDFVTHIYEADEILYTILLTFLSPLVFFFNGELIRGWLNTAVIGDSGTGKSATFVKFSDWLKLGDTFSALSGTRTGLLYAVKQRQGEWNISVGAYVRANGTILAIDETQEMEPEEIKKMAIAMDTGFLTVERVASGGYHTKTRTIFLMNPKKPSGQAATISEFLYGAECLQHCLAPMFIRRLDMAVFTTGNHQYQFYNQRTRESTGTQKLTALMMKTLIFWAWTRKASDIKWTKDATDTCLSTATAMSERYGYVDKIPLVSPQDFRMNLARIAAAYAVLDRSFSEDLTGLIVKPEHVTTVASLLKLIYSSSACDLEAMSKEFKAKNTIDGDLEKLVEFFHAYIKRDSNSPSLDIVNSKPFLQLVLTLESIEFIQRRELTEQLGVTNKWLSDRIASLLANRLIERHKFGFKRTKKFMIFMKQWRKVEGVSEMLDRVFADVCEVKHKEEAEMDNVDASFSDPMEQLLT